MYKQDYVQEWRKFVKGLSVASFATFDQAVQRMNVSGDPKSSPLRARLQKINDQTIWDNPIAEARTRKARSGFVAWFQRTILRRDPEKAAEQQPTGPIGKALDGLAHLVMPRQDQPPVIDTYFGELSKLRTRLNTRQV